MTTVLTAPTARRGFIGRLTLAAAALGFGGSATPLAAATLPFTRGHLAGWVLDAQSIKPGVKMPPNPLQPAELQALLGYLESLR